jgi:hypothetical protein
MIKFKVHAINRLHGSGLGAEMEGKVLDVKKLWLCVHHDS